jgi:predicted anti-sigma-YlaC factor YlaD
MTCSIIREGFSFYDELHDGDQRKKQMDEHLSTCGQCRQEFQVWQESLQLIREHGQQIPEGGRISERVMARIFDEQPWHHSPLSQINQRNSSLKYSLQAILVACFLIGIGIMSYALIGDMNATESLTRTTVEHTLVSLNDPAHTEIAKPENLYDELLALAISMTIGLLLLLSWFNRVQD